MGKKWQLVVVFLCCWIIFSCQENKTKIKSEQGSIDVVSNIYFQASESLDSLSSYHISQLNYMGNDIVELVPNLSYPNIIDRVYFIRDSLCYDMGSIKDAKSVILDNKKWFSVYEKKQGLLFLGNTIIPQYSKRVNISDTVLFKRKYKRFEIDNQKVFSRYYIYTTDTVVPYSLNKQIDIDYQGRLERIDTYKKEDDIFISVQLLYRDTINNVAQDIFDYQKFVNNKIR